jgi:hypothetical protein
MSSVVPAAVRIAYCPDWQFTINYKRRQFIYYEKLGSPCASHEGPWTSWGRIPLIPNPDTRWSSKFHITAILFPGKETYDTHWIRGWVVPRSFLEALQNIPCVALCRTPEDENTTVPRNVAKKQAVRFRKTRILYPSIYSQQRLLLFVSSQLNFGTGTVCALHCSWIILKSGVKGTSHIKPVITNTIRHNSNFLTRATP